VKKLVFFLMIISFGFGIWHFLAKASANADIFQQAGVSSAEIDPRLLKSTIQILVYPKHGDLRERGFGTLVTLAGESMILTHDHWDYLDDLDKVQIMNSENKFLLELSRSEFMHRVRYRDRGTLIFAAPDLPGLLPTVIRESYSPKIGDRIAVVHRSSDGRKRATSLSAQIHSVDTYNGLPVIRFTSPDGQRIRVGDSGGGVWHQGGLVANTWGMYVEEKGEFLAKTQTVQTSIAALVPGNYLDLIVGNQDASQLAAGSPIPDDLEKMAP
jgi:hypothetical protein